jgi:hypothetical protein
MPKSQFSQLGRGYDPISVKDAGVAIHSEAVRVARKLGQTVGQKNEYFITLDQLQRIISNVHTRPFPRH